MSQTEKPLSVAEVLEIEPTDDSWVNEGLHGIVQDITPSVSKQNKKYWKIVLCDHVNGAARIGFSVYFAPKFGVGDAIEIVGKGIKRKEFNGHPDIGIGKTTEFHVTGRGAPPQQERSNGSPGRSAAQNDSRESPPPHGEEPPPAAGSNDFYPDGSTIGMALKEARELLTNGLTHDQILAAISTAVFWEKLWQVSSDVVRVSNLMKRGRLAPSVKDRGASKGNAPKTPAPSTPPPSRSAPPAEQANPEDDQPF